MVSSLGKIAITTALKERVVGFCDLFVVAVDAKDNLNNKNELRICFG